LGNGSPWANSLSNITGKNDNTLENKNLDCDVSSSSSLNSSESYDTVQDSDIYLSDFNETNNGELHKSESREQISTATEPLNVDSPIPKPSASPAYHPASQIKLYNKSSHTAALIRLGPFGNLSTVVFDMCFNHHGKKEDWNAKESAAFNIEELILFYGAYRKNRQAKMLRFTVYKQWITAGIISIYLSCHHARKDSLWQCLKRSIIKFRYYAHLLAHSQRSFKVGLMAY